MIDIEGISKLMPSTNAVHREDEAAPKPLAALERGQQETFGDIEEKKASLKRELLQVVQFSSPA